MGFYTWVDDANLTGNVMADLTFASDSQRANGFQSGAVASSIRVNTALRQATLVTAALMESMSLNSLSYEDTFTNVRDGIDGFFAYLGVTANPDMTGQTPVALTGLKIKGSYYSISGGGGTSVTANPTLIGTETNLTSIQIASTKYKCADPATVAANSSAIASQAGSILGLQTSLSTISPSTGNGTFQDSLGNSIGTYSWYKTSNRVLFVRIDSYTGGNTNVDMGFKLIDFPSLHFDTTQAAYAYQDGMVAKFGMIRFYVSSGYAWVASFTSTEYYARTIGNAVNTWFTIILTQGS